MKQAVIIVAGGKGERMQSDIPKQFLEVAGKPILMHTIERFLVFDENILIVLVLPVDQIILWDELCKKYSFEVSYKVTTGGATRFESVKNGLKLIEPGCIVGIHDGVRPLVSADTIERCYMVAEKTGNAIPVIEIPESLRQLNVGESMTAERSAFRLVQTPQVFRSEFIIDAYQQEYLPEFTDDATVLESMGHTIQLVEGNPENIKITGPVDLKIAEALLG